MNGLYEVLDESAGRPGDDGQETLVPEPEWQWAGCGGGKEGGARSEAEIKDGGIRPASA